MKQLFLGLERRTLNAKLVVGFGTLLLMFLFLGLHAIQSQRVLNEETKVIYEQELLGISHIKEANIDLIYIGRALKQMMLASDKVGREEARQDLISSRARLGQELNEARKRILFEENKRKLAEFDILLARYLNNVDRAVALLEHEDYRQSEAVRFVSSRDYQSIIAGADSALTAISRNKELRAAAVAERADTTYQNGRQLTIALLSGGLGFGIVFGFLIGASIKLPTARLRETVESLAAGRLGVIVPNTDYPNEIGSLARSIQVLQGSAQQMEGERWVKSHIADISGLLQQALDFTELARSLLSSLAPLLKVGHGVFYIHQVSENQLRFLAGYGYRESADLRQSFAIGEGLIGQCARERAPLIVTPPPADYVKIHFSLGDATPTSIAILPILHQDRVLGIIELATFEQLSEHQLKLLERVVPLLASTMEILGRNVETQRLLKETQEQAARMEQQAALLEDQAVKLEAQQAELKRANFLSDTALDLSKAGYWHIPLDGSGYIHYSERAATLYGEVAKPDERYHMMDEWFARLEQADEEVAQANLKKLHDALGGLVDHYEAVYPYKRPADGKLAWIHAVGQVATIEIRKDQRFQELPIVAMTANAMAQDKDRCLAAGMNDHVAKPIDPDELFRVLIKWIKPRHRPAPAPEGRPTEMSSSGGDLPVIPGLDVELGLRRVLVPGKKPLYFKMLRKFVINQEHAGAQLTAAVEGGDLATAERLAHTAKSVNGNIGATPLQELAGQLEAAIREGTPRSALQPNLESFIRMLSAMIDRLKIALPPEPGHPSRASVDTARAHEVFHRLTELLTNDDGEACTIVEENLDLLRQILGPECFPRIDQAIQVYDFEKALELLKHTESWLDIPVLD